MTKKKDTVKAAKDAMRRDAKTAKSATRSQGALADRYVNQHTPQADLDWDNVQNNSANSSDD